MQQGCDEAIKDLVKGQIKDAFTSNDPMMQELRAQMFRQAGVDVPQLQAASQGQVLLPGAVSLTYPVDEITEPTNVPLLMPYGRMNKKKTVATGVVYPNDGTR